MIFYFFVIIVGLVRIIFFYFPSTDILFPELVKVYQNIFC